MKRIFIAQKMTGLSEKEVMKNRKICTDYLMEHPPKGFEGEKDIEYIDYYSQEAPPPEAVEHTHERLWYLGHSIQLLSTADLVIFANDAADAKGCVVQRLICEMYDIPFLEMEIHTFNSTIKAACWNLAGVFNH